MTDVALPRLRQIALVAHDLEEVCGQLEDALDVRDPFHDPGVGEFGLHNAVYEMGDTFLEVVSPVRDGTTAGRYLERRGGDAGYMAIFQVADTTATRKRAEEMGLRVVWQIDLDDISGTHLHPQDMKGAIVSFDTPIPEESWRWAGPRWTGAAPSSPFTTTPITGAVVRVTEVATATERWRELLGADLVQFQPAESAADEGIATVFIAGLSQPTEICGVQFAP